MNRVLRHLAPLLLLSLALCSVSRAQATYTASRLLDLQVGGGYTLGNTDYVTNEARGFAFYSDLDFKSHFGAELTFHQISDPNSSVDERTYEAGVRYFRHYGRFHPYVKILYGRGVFNSPVYEYTVTGSNGAVYIDDEYSNLAYNMVVGGGGLDISVHPRVNIRADFEYQDWFSGPGLTNGLTPTLFTIGAAYHFPPGNPRGRRR